jgi:TRAP-type C4-dicarboxylate transport system permease small subunit
MNITGKDIFGYILLAIIGATGAAIVFRQVTEQTSYGLHEIIAILAVVAGAFGQAYFAEARQKKADKSPPEASSTTQTAPKH